MAAIRDGVAGGQWEQVPQPWLAVRWSREREFPADHPMRGSAAYRNWEPSYTELVFLNLVGDAVIMRVCTAPWVNCRDTKITLSRALAVAVNPASALGD